MLSVVLAQQSSKNARRKKMPRTGFGEANKAEEQKKKESEEIERAYKDMLKRTTREQPAKKTDPWENLR
jgi:hypothetical protein